MVKGILTRKNILVILGGLFAAFFIYQSLFLRSIGYERIPNIGIFDERNYVWQGMSLRKYGIPVGWSNLGTYEQESSIPVSDIQVDDFTLRINGQKADFKNYKDLPKPALAVIEHDFGFGTRHQRFVAPFIDHPPLGGLIFSLGVSETAKSFLDITPEEFRNMALYIAPFNAILLFIYILLATGNPVIGAIAVGLYSTVPTFVLASRYALLENALIPLALLHINLLLLSKHFFDQHRSTIAIPLLFTSAFIGGSMVLVKESGGGFIIGSLVLLYLWNIQKKLIFIFTIIPVLIVLVYIMWGLWLSPEVFLGVIKDNGSRGFFGSLNVLSMIPTQRFESFPLDGWWLWGFVSLLVIGITEGSKYLTIFIPFLAHFLTVLFFAGANHPWYYLALIPFSVIGGALSIWKIATAPTLAFALGFLLVPLSTSFYWGYSVFHLPANTMLYRILLLGFVLLTVIRVIQNKLLVRVLWIIVMTALTLFIFQWNYRGLLYIIGHWQNLPIPSLPYL